MRVVAMIARILLGLMFVVFGANAVVPFMPTGPLPGGTAGQFISAMAAAHYMVPVGIFMVLSGLLLLINVFVPLALVILGPILVNILLFHLLMAPKTIVMGLVCTLLWFLVFSQNLSAFRGILQPKPAA